MARAVRVAIWYAQRPDAHPIRLQRGKQLMLAVYSIQLRFSRHRRNGDGTKH